MDEIVQITKVFSNIFIILKISFNCVSDDFVDIKIVEELCKFWIKTLYLIVLLLCKTSFNFVFFIYIKIIEDLSKYLEFIYR